MIVSPSLHLGQPVKLGRLPKREDRRDLMLASYIKTDVPLVYAPARDWTTTMGPLKMRLNDQYGNCTIAGIGNFIQANTGAKGSPIDIPDSTILKTYSDWDGYVLGDPSTDNGGVEVDVLNKWRQRGIADATGFLHKLGAFAKVETRNHPHVKATIDWFGGAYIGISLPVSAQHQVVWTVTGGADQGDPTPNSWGGHCVVLEAYDDDGLWCVTWGQRKRLTWAWLDVYAGDGAGGEIWAPLSPDWVQEGAPSPSGLALENLQADLAIVTG